MPTSGSLHPAARGRVESLGDIPATTAESDAMSKDLKRRGFRFVGNTICYAFMQSAGLVDDHVESCFRATSPRSPSRWPDAPRGIACCGWALVVLVGVVINLVVLVVTPVLRPELNLLEKSLSYYAVGPWGAIQAAAFLALAFRQWRWAWRSSARTSRHHGCG